MHPAIRSVLPALSAPSAPPATHLHRLQSASLTRQQRTVFLLRQATNPRLWMTTPRRGLSSAGCGGNAPTDMKKATTIFLQNYSDRENASLLAINHVSSILSSTLPRLETV